MRIKLILLTIFILAAVAAKADTRYEYMRSKVYLNYEVAAKRTGALEDIPVFKGTVINRGDKPLRLVEITLSFLDQYGSPSRKMIFYPVKYYKYLIGSHGIPLQSKYETDFNYLCRDCSMRWFQNFKAEVTDVDFVKEGFSLNRLYNPFVVLYEKMQSIKK